LNHRILIYRRGTDQASVRLTRLRSRIRRSEPEEPQM